MVYVFFFFSFLTHACVLDVSPEWWSRQGLSEAIGYHILRRYVVNIDTAFYDDLSNIMPGHVDVFGAPMKLRVST